MEMDRVQTDGARGNEAGKEIKMGWSTNANGG